MKVTKQQIMDGLIRYIRTDVVDGVTNSNFKIMLHAAASALEVNDNAFGPIFDNPLFKIAFVEEGGMYDITQAEKILASTLDSSGGFTLEIPAVKFILPKAQELTFGADDIHKLCAYIRGDK